MPSASLLIAAAHHGNSIIDTIDSLLSSAGTFFSQLASLSWPSLLIGLALYGLYLLLRSRALFNAVRAAYPGGQVRWRDVLPDATDFAGFGRVPGTAIFPNPIMALGEAGTEPNF